MKNILLVALLLVALGTYAQEKRTIYYNAEWDSTSQANAFYSREITETNGLYKIADNYINGDKLLTGYLSKITADNWNYREGHWAFYHPTGSVMEEGNYKGGSKEGLWMYYPPHSTKKWKEILWHNNEMQRLTDYNEEDWKLEKVTEFTNGRKTSSVGYGKDDSSTMSFTYDGEHLIKTIEKTNSATITTEYEWLKDEVVGEKRVKNGIVTYLKRFDFVTEYYDNGKVWKKGEMKKGELNYYECYGVNGKDTSCKTDKGAFQFVEQMPSPAFDLRDHLINNMHYPEYARIRNIEGRVQVQFVVFEDGSVGDVTIKKSVHPSLDAEAYRVVSIMPKWNPGMQNGKKVKVFYTQPINFKLE